jgi:hypothetical protein
MEVRKRTIAAHLIDVTMKSVTCGTSYEVTTTGEKANTSAEREQIDRWDRPMCGNDEKTRAWRRF